MVEVKLGCGRASVGTGFPTSRARSARRLSGADGRFVAAVGCHRAVVGLQSTGLVIYRQYRIGIRLQADREVQA